MLNMKKYKIKMGNSPFMNSKDATEHSVYLQYPYVYWIYERFCLFFYRKTVVFEYTKEQAEQTAKAVFA